MHLYKRKKKHFIRWVLVLGIFFLAVLFLAAGSKRMEETAWNEQQELLSDAINQAVVNCYAMEGRYPESLEVLKTEYGLQYDSEEFFVDYQVYGANLMPDVMILERT